MNKPRLIDANGLYKLIEENSYTLVDRINSKDKGMFLTGIKEAIEAMPTAYDIDKVVEQLEEKAKAVYNEIEGDYINYVALENAIKIVKGNYSENPNSLKGGAVDDETMA